MTFGQVETVNVGDCFLNERRASMVRVTQLNGEWASIITWRPNGVKTSMKGKCKAANLLLKPYVRAKAVQVYGVDGQSWGFGLTPEGNA
jgi:hypothetical protein